MIGENETMTMTVMAGGEPVSCLIQWRGKYYRVKHGDTINWYRGVLYVNGKRAIEVVSPG